MGKNILTIPMLSNSEWSQINVMPDYQSLLCMLERDRERDEKTERGRLYDEIKELSKEKMLTLNNNIIGYTLFCYILLYCETPTKF